MSPVLGKKVVGELLDLVVEAAGTEHLNVLVADRLVRQLHAALKPKRAVLASKKRRGVKKETRREEWAGIREKVLARARGYCESCAGRPIGYELEVDHQFGGSRRLTLQSVFTCRALCRGCHRAKTDNKPDGAWWCVDFIAHCERMLSAEKSCPGLDNGYRHAAEIARKRLDSLTLQGRGTA